MAAYRRVVIVIILEDLTNAFGYLRLVVFRRGENSLST